MPADSLASAARELLGRQRPQHVELVAVRIGHHHPTHVRTLADVDAPSAETFQARHLGRLVLWPQIEVEAVLRRLLLGGLEEQVRDDAVLGAAGRRLENDLTVAFVSTTPPERGLPKGRQPRGIRGTDAQALDAKSHPAILARFAPTVDCISATLKAAGSAGPCLARCIYVRCDQRGGGRHRDERWASVAHVVDAEQEPDYRMSLAAERTYLAYMRTALALMAAGIGVAGALPDAGGKPLRRVIGVVLVLAGGGLLVAARRRWLAVDQAMRRGEPLPTIGMLHALSWLLAAAAVAAAILVFVL